MHVLYRTELHPRGSRQATSSLSHPLRSIWRVETTPSRIGARAEMEVAAALTRAGKRVYAPFFAPDSRVDLLYEDDAGFHRVQVKSAVVKGDVIVFRTSSNTKNIVRDYRGEIDLFGVYSPELHQVFLVPIDGMPRTFCQLRLNPSRNGQSKGVRWAWDYLLEATLKSA